jgi:zinc D-Ala-D-Ala carboxypeptidase
MKLSKNFSLYEFTKSMTALRKNIDNKPSKEHIENLKILCEKVLQPARDEFGPITINSGFRSKALNKAVGGSGKSNHCFGFAADIEAKNVSNYILLRWIFENTECTELIAEYLEREDERAGWVHVAYNPKREKCDIIKLKNKEFNYEPRTLVEMDNYFM